MLVRFVESPPGTVDVDDLLSDATVKAYIEHYNQQLNKFFNGEFGHYT